MKWLISFFVVLSFYIFPLPASAQIPPEQQYYKARVEQILQDGKKDIGGKQNIFQQVSIRLLEGPQKDQVITVEHGGMFVISKEQKVVAGGTVILRESQGPQGKKIYSIADRYRIPQVLWILAGFFLVVVGIAGKKGLGAIIGMVVSLS